MGEQLLSNIHMNKPKIENPLPSEYLMKANEKKTRCVDEREPDAKTVNDGIAIPGATFGIIDAIKTLTGASEEEAWDRATKAGIPMNGHDDTHHGPKGCGYERLVEEEPASVLAVESVPAATRKAKLEEEHGTVITLLGDHQPTEAIINYREGTTIDTKKAVNEHRGIFDLDAWALSAMAEKLGIDTNVFTAHVIDVYKHTVTKLTGITEFAEVR